MNKLSYQKKTPSALNVWKSCGTRSWTGGAYIALSDPLAGELATVQPLSKHLHPALGPSPGGLADLQIDKISGYGCAKK